MLPSLVGTLVMLVGGSGVWLVLRQIILSHATRSLLAASLLAAVVAAVTPWTGPATLLAAALTITAVLIPTDRAAAVNLLSGTASVGLGLAAIGGGVAPPDRDHTN